MLRQLSRALCSRVAATHPHTYPTIVGVQVFVNGMLTLEMSDTGRGAVLFIVLMLTTSAGQRLSSGPRTLGRQWQAHRGSMHPAGIMVHRAERSRLGAQERLPVFLAGDPPMLVHLCLQ